MQGGEAMSKGYSIRVNIGGKSFSIISSEKPEYLADVADRVDKSISSMLLSNPALTYEKAAILSALKFCDDAKKGEEERQIADDAQKNNDEDNLRRQLVEYSKELSRLTQENKLLHKNIYGYHFQIESKHLFS